MIDCTGFHLSRFIFICLNNTDKFYGQQDLGKWAAQCGAKAGDLLLILSGPRRKTQTALCELRLEMGNRLGLRSHEKFAPLWVVDFPLLEWDDQTQRFYAMHHPFTSPNPEDIGLFDTDPGKIRANAYDFVCNGTEIGGGSIRIHDSALQAKMFGLLGFTPEEAQVRFGFLMNAFKYGAPPHGGLAFGFDRLCSLFGGSESIRDYIAFPKNNAGRDVMLDAPGFPPVERNGDEQIKRDSSLKCGLHRPGAVGRTVSGTAEAGGIKFCISITRSADK